MCEPLSMSSSLSVLHTGLLTGLDLLHTPHPCHVGSAALCPNILKMSHLPKASSPHKLEPSQQDVTSPLGLTRRELCKSAAEEGLGRAPDGLGHRGTDLPDELFGPHARRRRVIAPWRSDVLRFVFWGDDSGGYGFPSRGLPGSSNSLHSWTSLT